MTPLNTVLSGLYDGLSGVHTNFVRYDDRLSGLLSAVQEISTEIRR